MAQEIKSEVICDGFKSTYVGYLFSVDGIETNTVEQVNTSLSFIKMSYRCNCKNNIVTTTPDMVYKMMVEYVLILPADANKWSFLFP